MSKEETDRALSTHRKRRGVAKASITRLANRLKDLESDISQPAVVDHAQRMQRKLDSLDVDFRSHHRDIIDLTDDEDSLSKEQEVLDEHDDVIAELSVRISQLIGVCTSSQLSTSPRKIASRKLARIEKTLSDMNLAVAALEGDPDSCLLRQYEEQVSDVKKELSDTHNELLKLELDDSDDLVIKQETLEKTIFDCAVTIKKQIASVPERGPPTVASDGKGMKLPKLDVPTFDGNILNWRTFWEQFCVAVHDRSNLSDSEKLVYLQHSLKSGSARSAIEGLSRSGDNYSEAVECLQDRYDRPRLIHQTHARLILEAPALKDGTGKELRRLHDTVQQHLRALKAMSYEPPGAFITSMLELKLDTNTMFEWQRHSQDSTDVPHYSKLLEFLNLRAQASETSVPAQRNSARGGPPPDKRPYHHTKPIVTFAVNAMDPSPTCLLCKTDKHPLYACAKFKSLSHERKLSTLRDNHLCMNCLKPGHFVRECKSLHRCRKCQKPHHTLLHMDAKDTPPRENNSTTSQPTSSIVTNLATGIPSHMLLMTCQVLVHGPDGLNMQIRALLDSASSACLISERLTQVLHLPRTLQNVRISGVAGLSQAAPLHSIVQLDVSPLQVPADKLNVSAIVVPRVTCDLPVKPVIPQLSWTHLSDIPLADPDFGSPGRIDLLLGIDVFIASLLHGRRTGPPDSPTAFETKFGWVLAGCVEPQDHTCHQVTAHHTSIVLGDDILRKFWEIEESPRTTASFSPEERMVVQHFNENHRRTEDGRFIVPLPRKPHAPLLGESRSQAVRRFLALERSLCLRREHSTFNDVMQEYFDMQHAEPVPTADLEKPESEVFYLPMHAVRKESSSTTKVRAVFDASAKSSTGVSLNDLLLVGPTVHPTLIDVLLRFRLHRIALTTDVSKMYRAVELTEPDRDLHRFVWRQTPDHPLQDFRMTRVTFGVSASSFAANASIKRNAQDFAVEYPQAASVVENSFYVDDGLTGADSVEESIRLQKQLQNLFSKGGFLLRKWNSSEISVLQHIPAELRDSQSFHNVPDTEEYTKTLGVEWNSTSDYFRLTVAKLPSTRDLTKRLLVSDVAKTFDVLGWFSPTIIKIKILLQRIWELKIDWDDPLPSEIKDTWLQWRIELSILSEKHIPRCHFPKQSHIVAMELHGFSDASEEAYAGVVYLRIIDSSQEVHVSLVTSKTKVAPLKRLTIPRLELCGALLLAQLLHHVRQVFHLPINCTYAWTDSTIVLNWLTGNPRRFKTYVGNRTSHIMELIPPDRWNHVSGMDNPADCASRGVFPTELLNHHLWWDGPTWLKLPSSGWPQQLSVPVPESSDEECRVCHLTLVEQNTPIIPLDRFSSFNQLKRITAWILRFIENCRSREHRDSLSPHLCTEELMKAESYWISLIQKEHFSTEIFSLQTNLDIHQSSVLFTLHPFLDSNGLLRVGGRIQNAQVSYTCRHPVILYGKHQITKLIIATEHSRLLHAGPTLVAASLSRRYHIIGCHKAVRSITRRCITCRRTSAKPQNQMLGQLPLERVTPGSIFDRVGVDYAGPFNVKYGSVRKPTVIKAYVCVFVSLTVKAVHLELVSDLTTDAFIASLRRFMARRGKPSLIWSDHGTNFVGAVREMKELSDFLELQKSQGLISRFCSSQNISWKFIPERAPNFGGLWEATVRSMKTHLKRVVADTRLTFEELSTVISQIEACLNSRPLVPMSPDDDGLEVLTPGHFLVGKPLESLPDPAFSYRNFSLLRRWHLCQSLVRHFWKRWSSEYLSILRRYTKWHHPTRNLQVGDIVLLQEDDLIPTKWPLGKVVKTFPGRDQLVRVVEVKTQTGIYKRPVSKVALLLPTED